MNEIAEEAKPAVGRVDPLVERLSLTVDAANLELMRVDQILEDVTQITDSVSKAAGARRYRDERSDRFGELAHGQVAQQVQAALRLR